MNGADIGAARPRARGGSENRSPRAVRGAHAVSIVLGRKSARAAATRAAGEKNPRYRGAGAAARAANFLPRITGLLIPLM